MNLSVLDIYDGDDSECTLIVALDLNDLDKMSAAARRGATLMPAIDMAALGRDMETRRPITSLQFLVAATDEDAHKTCDGIAEALGLRNRKFNDLGQPGYRAGMIQKGTTDVG